MQNGWVVSEWLTKIITTQLHYWQVVQVVCATFCNQYDWIHTLAVAFSLIFRLVLSVLLLCGFPFIINWQMIFYYYLLLHMSKSDLWLQFMSCALMELKLIGMSWDASYANCLYHLAQCLPCTKLLNDLYKFIFLSIQ